MIEHIGVIQDKCIACRRCEVACIAAHHDMDFKEAMKHRDSLVARVQVIKMEGLKTTVRCHQCDPAPCANVCPTHALRQAEDGRIKLNPENCIACKMCVSVCPYGTIQMDSIDAEDQMGVKEPTECVFPHREVAVRCDMCYAWRMENGKKITACMEVCPVRALYMIEPDGAILEAPPIQKKASAKAPKVDKAPGSATAAKAESASSASQKTDVSENKPESVIAQQQPEKASPAT